MTNKSKIEKWNLGDEVINLSNDEGMSTKAIAKYISKKYPDVHELQNISHMAIHRYLSSVTEDEVRNKLDEIKNPNDYITQEFNLKMAKNIQDAERLNDLTREFTRKLEDKDVSTVDLKRIVESWKTTNDQVRKNLVSLRQFMDVNVIKPTQNIIYKKETNVKNLVLDLSRDLCPECKRKAEEKVKEYIKS